MLGVSCIINTRLKLDGWHCMPTHNGKGGGVNNDIGSWEQSYCQTQG